MPLSSKPNNQRTDHKTGSSSNRRVDNKPVQTDQRTDDKPIQTNQRTDNKILTPNKQRSDNTTKLSTEQGNRKNVQQPKPREKVAKQVGEHTRNEINASTDITKAFDRLGTEDKKLVSTLTKSSPGTANAVLKALTVLDQDPNKNDAAKQTLLRDLRGGSHSMPNQSQSFLKAAPSIVALYVNHPELASDALDLAQTAKHPQVLARGVGVLGALRETRAKSNPKLPQLEARGEQNALKLGGLLGGDFFDRMNGYYGNRSDTKRFDLAIDETRTQNRKKEILSRLLQPEDKFKIPNDALRKEAENAVIYLSDGVGNKLATGLATSLIDNGGNINLTGDFAKLRDDMHFHPSMLNKPEFTLITNVESMIGTLSDPKTAGPYKEVLGKVAKVESGGKNLVAKTLGKKRDQVTPTDGKRALMSGMLMPLFQGKVGSCFATLRRSINARRTRLT